MASRGLKGFSTPNLAARACRASTSSRESSTGAGPVAESDSAGAVEQPNFLALASRLATSSGSSGSIVAALERVCSMTRRWPDFLGNRSSARRREEGEAPWPSASERDEEATSP
eukprot:scaffold251207_cov35-Tisochrysis_lutea.AAC.1